MRHSELVLVIVLVIPTTHLFAQQPPVHAGERVRVTAPDCGMHGHATTIQALRGDTLVLPADPTRSSNSVTCPLNSVTGLDVSRWRKSWGWRKGALVGLLSGGALGALVGSWTYEECDPYEAACAGIICFSDCDFHLGREVHVALHALAVGSAGALLGALIGASSETDRWEEVPLDQLQVSIAPQREGVSFALRIAF